MEQFHVRWRVSPYDLRHGIPRDVLPHLVAGAVGVAWVLAPSGDGGAGLRWLGVAVVVLQVAAIGRSLVRHALHLRGADHVLTVRSGAYVVTDLRGATRYDAPLAGVVDDRGVLRLEFTDGTVLEAPWRAFASADLRQLRQHLREQLGALDHPHHVPVRSVGAVTGTGAWRRPLLALGVAVLLGALPWLLALPA